MSNRTITMTDTLYDYLLNVSVREPDVLTQLRDTTAKMGQVARMQIAPEQGQFMAMLVRLMQAKRILEVGVFTGYSALACALALPEDGHITACDVNPEWTKTALKYWEQAGVANKISLKIAPALETLDELLASGLQNHFDMMFIDADKQSYLAYYEKGLQLLRPGGVILVDNVLWGGDVADGSVTDDNTNALRQFNRFLSTDERIHLSMVPVGDGITMAQKI